MAKRLVVIGGGAAGFFCAVNAARLRPGLEVIIVEKSGKLLSKVRVSGGGRCNVTHACFDITDMSRRYPRGANFVKKIFHLFFTTDTISWFAERGVVLKEEADGRMFPVTDSSQTIIDALLREASRYGISIRMHTEVSELLPLESGFRLMLGSTTSADKQALDCDYVCIASGGYPKSSLFNWITRTGHSIAEPVPSLFTFNMPGHGIASLMGLSVERVRVKIKGGKIEQEGPLLITHWGFSGPGILRLSAWEARTLAIGQYRFTLLVNWLPDYTEPTLREKFQSLRHAQASQLLDGRNPFGLPQRLWLFFLSACGVRSGLRWADLPIREQNKLIQMLCSGSYEVSGKTTFKEEFVTAGGVLLAEVDPSTLQSRKLPGLYFAGEVLDVDGITGGFNFQHAWTTGFIAASSIAAVAQ